MDEAEGRWPPNSLLFGLPDSTVAGLLELGTLREYESGQVLLHQGDQSTHVLLLVRGCVKVTATTPEGYLALLAIRVDGEIIGELASLDEQSRSATVTAAGRVRTRVVSRTAFHDFLATHPDAAVAVGRSVGMKLRWSTRRRVDFGGFVAHIRLARVLAELAVNYGHSTSEGITLGVSLTQPELAALVGAAEPTVHKALAELRRRDVIITRYRRTVVRDIAKLQMIARIEES